MTCTLMNMMFLIDENCDTNKKTNNKKLIIISKKPMGLCHTTDNLCKIYRKFRTEYHRILQAGPFCLPRVNFGDKDSVIKII